MSCNMLRVWPLVLAIMAWLYPSVCRAVEVSTVMELQAAVQTANNGGAKNIVLLPGTYQLDGVYLRLTADGITITGQSSDRSAVILDGGYVTTEILQILGSNIHIANLTLMRARYHPVHIYPDDRDVVGTLLSNIHIIDPGQQAVKINQNAAKTHSVMFGRLENSHLELTQAGREKVWEINGSCYTGGVDAHHARSWEVAENTITGFWCADGLAEHGIHFWSDSEDTLVEKNSIVNCDRGIGFGLGTSGHRGGIIRNNMIYHDSGHAYSDVGIGLENARQAMVYNNTIFHQHSYANAIEFRFAGTMGGTIANNLTNRRITSRNGGQATLFANHTAAEAVWFRNIDRGDLHLTGKISGVVDSGTALTGLSDDFDGQSRMSGSGVDIGADEWYSHEVEQTEGKAEPWLMLLLH